MIVLFVLYFRDHHTIQYHPAFDDDDDDDVVDDDDDDGATEVQTKFCFLTKLYHDHHKI